MHELGLARQLLAQAIATAEREHASRIEAIRIVVGEGAHPGTVETLDLTLRLLIPGTVADAAELTVESSGDGDNVMLASVEVA